MADSPDLGAETIGEGMSEFGDEFARHFGSLADLFTEWRQPETAGMVFDTVISGDREAFQKLLRFDGPSPGPDPIDPPDPSTPRAPDFCAIVMDVVEKLIPKTNVFCCRLRTDLTSDEKRTYLMLVLWARRTGNLPPIDTGSDFSEVGAPGPVVPAGPFLEKLRAANLVNCGFTCWVDGGVGLQLTPPTRMCARP